MDAVLDAAAYVRAVQHRQGIKIGAPEEPAWRQGLLSDEELRARGEAQTETEYGTYLLELLRPAGVRTALDTHPPAAVGCAAAGLW